MKIVKKHRLSKVFFLSLKEKKKKVSSAVGNYNLIIQTTCFPSFDLSYEIKSVDKLGNFSLSITIKYQTTTGLKRHKMKIDYESKIASHFLIYESY